MIVMRLTADEYLLGPHVLDRTSPWQISSRHPATPLSFVYFRH